MSEEMEGSEAPEGQPAPRRRHRRGLLKLYYGVKSEDEGARADPTDIDGPHFKTEVFLERLYKEASLQTLMEKETSMIREIKSLDSDMQTLVYENYNKFISATDTIRTMKHDFKRMEDEMESLAANMGTIRDFSDKINDTLADKRQKIKKLSGVHGMLKKLQFLFELPSRLTKCMEMDAHSQAVRYYCKASGILDHFQHMPSFQGIREDCHKIVDKLRVKLKGQLLDESATAAQLSECVDLLLQLKEPAEDLCDQFLARSRVKLDGELAKLSESQEETTFADILQFIDFGCNRFLSNLSLVIVSFQELFLKPQVRGQEDQKRGIISVARPKLVEFVNRVLYPYLDIVGARLITEAKSKETNLLVRAVDRLHRRLQALGKLVPMIDMAKICMDIVLPASNERVKFCSQDLKNYFSSCLMDVRQALATRAKHVRMSSDGGPSGLFSELLSSLSLSTIDKLKATLTSLKEFVASDVTFASKQYFRTKFCRDWVCNGLVVGFMEHIFAMATGLCEEAVSREATGPPLILIFSRFCLDFEQSTISYLVSLTDELFPLLERGPVSATPISRLCALGRQSAQKLVTFYVEAEGNGVSQMIRKSVETRDWLSSIEPRNVRAVMKRVVEDLTTLDLQVGTLYEEGSRKDRSSDDSRRTWTYSQSRQMGKPWGYTPGSAVDTSLLSNIQKLFSERIEIFSAVEFTKVSVLTGIIKIMLKTLMECVRMKTFGKFGLQQIQVDSHYLQLYLWRFVSDENLVLFLLDEVMNSAVNRCIEPMLMEPSVVEVICNQG